MESLFQDLKRAREAKRLSILDVSDATLINASFLEAIEQGNTTILPQTYVRAFIREYASFVGLDPVEVMKRYDLTQEDAKAPPPKEEPPAPEPEPEQTPSTRADDGPTLQTPVVAKFALPVIFILALSIILWNLTRTKAPPELKEVPVDSASRNSSVRDDSMSAPVTVSQRKAAPSSPDSLTLHLTAMDSVWVEVVVDATAPRQYLFAPNRKISWKAKEHFKLNVGNAGIVDLTLNDKHLGAPGRRGIVLRNIEIDRQTLLKK